MIRVAFSVFGGAGWTGGINYLRNLLAATSDLPERAIEPLLFIAPETPASSVDALRPYLAKPPIVVAGWGTSRGTRMRRLIGSGLFQRDSISEDAFRREGVDVVFQHAAWYGMTFSIPTLAWIADFQHRHLPQMFSRGNVLKRDLGYWALSHAATRIMLSSQDALKDCESFFPAARGKTSVLPFCVQLPNTAHGIAPTDVADLYQLPQRYFYLPNQLWKHKNHLRLLEALKLSKDQGHEIVVVATGNPSDVRNPSHPGEVLQTAKRLGLEDSFRFLGLVPYDHVMPLMRGSVAVINPSLFEGWSTTVEEAKAIGLPMILSDIALHREQAGDSARYFDPMNPRHIAQSLADSWQHSKRTMTEEEAMAAYRIKQSVFANNFLAILEQTLAR